ncbi:hypothetical protein TsocGM_18895 [Tautonia sociabilis]|uniref:Uncharacterized protein n=1 Tax=Tautonia sociabilis TaxID=2080755 RepID=A0A432MFV0_9BACT|nr:hypothetical protein TsocGM_18895 [Tautonia sociabilis]
MDPFIVLISWMEDKKPHEVRRTAERRAPGENRWKNLSRPPARAGMAALVLGRRGREALMGRAPSARARRAVDGFSPARW